MKGAKAMKDNDCIFCKIACGDIPSATVYEDDMFRVILDMGPATRGHALILPKEHYEDLTVLDESYASRALILAARVGRAMKKALGCSGFNIVQNNGESAGQTVHHFHIHIIPRYDNGSDIVSWTPGKVGSDELSSTAASIGKEM